MKVTGFELDWAKRAFQPRWAERETGKMGRQQIERAHLAEFFANRAPAVIGMEACGSAHC